MKNGANLHSELLLTFSEKSFKVNLGSITNMPTSQDIIFLTYLHNNRPRQMILSLSLKLAYHLKKPSRFWHILMNGFIYLGTSKSQVYKIGIGFYL